MDDVSFGVDAGSMVGYIGPNGAGKSTTVKMLIGILVPSAGRVQVAGLDPSRARTEVARRIGVVFGQRTQLWWDLPLRDSFDLLRHVYRVPGASHPPTRRPSPHYWTSGRSSTPRYASSHWASACGASWPLPSCTTRRSSSSTNPPSDSIWS